MMYCILAYPLLVHVSVLTDSPLLGGLALLALYGGFAYPALARRRAAAWIGLLAATIASLVLVRYDAQFFVMVLPPIVLPVALAAWWGATLHAGRTPFITQLARSIRGELSVEHAAYTRRVTVLWVCVFVLLATLGAGAALAGDPALWSWLTNLGAPILVGLVFVLEYAYRRWHLRHESHPDFVTFLRQVARAGVRPGSRA